MRILMAAMGLDIGGAETHILELSRELKRRGYDVAVASNGGVYVKEIEEAGIRHYSVPMHRRSVSLMIRSYFMLGRVIKKERPDIVHAHARIPAFICGYLKKRFRFPFVTTAHWVFKTSGGLRLLTDWGDKTVAVSEDIKEYLKVSYGLPEDDIFVTINGIDTEKFSPGVSGEKVRAEFGIPGEAPLISHVSRMDEGRELAASGLIAAAPELAKAVPGAVVLIAGGGDVFGELLKKADKVNKKLKRRCVVMTGPRTDINEITAAADVFVGVSRAALEAMAAAKPVVVAGNEGYIGIFTEDKLEKAVEGNFCCRGCGEISVAALTRDVIACFSMTEEERRAVGGYGRGVILERYSASRMADDTLRAYRAATPAKKVVMSGYYGFSNAGDEAILASVYGSIKRSVPDAEITVLSKTPRATESMYGCKAAGRFNPWHVYRAIRRCDLLISGGGSLLQDRTSTRSLLYYLYIIRTAERMGKKVMLYANGIGPIIRAANRGRVRRAAEAADVITLRDGDSLSELGFMGVKRPDMAVTADPVYLLDAADGARVEEILREAGVPDGGFIAVSVRRWDGMEGFAGKMAAVCDGLYERFGENIVFVAMQPAGDSEAAREIIKKMSAPAYEVCGGAPLELMGVIGRADMMLSMRLHSLIFAARMGVPVAGVAYDPKVESSLKMLSMPEIGTLEAFDADYALQLAVELFENRKEASDRLREKAEELRSLALKNEDHIKKLIG